MFYNLESFQNVIQFALGICVSVTVLVPGHLISGHLIFFYFYGEKSPASVVKVPGVTGSWLLF